MSDLTPASSFDNVYQLETADLALAGTSPSQVMNRQPQALLNRTQFIRNEQIADGSRIDQAEADIDALHAFDVSLTSTNPAEGLALLPYAGQTAASTLDKGRLDSVSQLVGLIGVGADIAETISYWSGWGAALAGPVGGATYIWDTSRPKSQHNAGNIISPTVPWNGSEGTFAAYIAKTGETDPAGSGCWVHKNLTGNEFNVLQWGAKNDASTAGANNAMIQPLMNYMEASVGGGRGGVAKFPRGNYAFGVSFNVRDRVTLRGDGTEASILHFSTLTSGDAVVLGPVGPNHPFSPPGAHVFGTRLENLSISGGNVYKGSEKALVYTDGAHEHSGLFNVVLRDFVSYGVHYNTGNGGPAFFNIESCEIYGSDTLPSLGTKRGVVCNAGGALIMVKECTIAGGPTNKLAQGILMLKDNLVGTGLHFEKSTVGISLSQTDATQPRVNSISGATGNSTVPTLVDISSSFKGSLSADSLLNKSLSATGLVTLINRANNNESISDSFVANYSWPNYVAGSSNTVDAGWFGVKGDGLDYSAQLQAAINFAAASVNGAQGMVVHLPRGVIGISTTITLPNRVAVYGANGRGTVIKPVSPFASAYMFAASNGTSSMFGSRLEDMYIDARGFNMTAVVYSVAWQETCGMNRVLLQFDGTTQFGFLYETGYGGAAILKFRDIEMFSDSTAATKNGIQINQVSVSGGFVFIIENSTIAGSIANPLTRGINMVNDSIVANALHVEHCGIAVFSQGAGNVDCNTITGSGNAVTDLVAISSGFTGKVNLRSMLPNGATGNIFTNSVNGQHISASGQRCASHVYPVPGFNVHVSAQIPNVTGNGTEYTILFNSERFDLNSNYNPATGIFTAPESGKYHFNCAVKLTPGATTTTCVIKIVTTSKEYIVYRGDIDTIRDSSGTITLCGGVLADLANGDTSRIRVTVSGVGADTVDIEAAETWFTGYKLGW